jgi:endonuclease/exonuclease/phosphatase family metal-dependent hydrolase
MPRSLGEASGSQTTHLDPDDWQFQMNQAAEFLAGPAQTPLPIVWVGDFNSDAERAPTAGKPPATPTYQYIIESGFSDAWKATNTGQPGFTCCQEIDLSNPVSQLGQRVDLVLTRGKFRVVDASIVGEDPSKRVPSRLSPSGLWPSDHAGVVVTLELQALALPRQPA